MSLVDQIITEFEKNRQFFLSDPKYQFTIAGSYLTILNTDTYIDQRVELTEEQSIRIKAIIWESEVQELVEYINGQEYALRYKVK